MKHLFILVFLNTLFSNLNCLEIPENYIPVQGLIQPIELITYIPEPQIAEIEYCLPIAAFCGVNIAQGPINRRPNRSHSYYSCLYAIDFVTPYDHAPAKIIAARKGLVTSLNEGCTSADPIHHCDTLGDGFGNWVGILHEDGDMSLYAHLQEVHVKIGQIVDQGQILGIEGTTGSAGSRHLHFSVHKSPFGNKNEKIDFTSVDLSLLSRPYWYPTIPYRLRYLNHDYTETVVDIRTFQNLDWDREFTLEPRLYPL